jgi:broad specificity polyphosphatase/5'/3'-nucleotidase SurE
MSAAVEAGIEGIPAIGFSLLTTIGMLILNR